MSAKISERDKSTPIFWFGTKLASKKQAKLMLRISDVIISAGAVSLKSAIRAFLGESVRSKYFL